MENLELSDYQGKKEKIREELNRVAESFVLIGYELKQIDDNGLYKLDGYSTITEFAEKEYNLNQTATSRFISINEKYSDGSSPKLLPKYEGYGYTKLSEMLTLSDEEMKLVTVQSTRAEIREIKLAKKEAQTENYAPAHNEENTDNTQSEEEFQEGNQFNIPEAEKLIIELFRDKSKRTVLNDLAAELRGKVWSKELEIKAAEIINPSGHYLFRLKFIIMIFEEESIKYSKFSGDTLQFTYRDFVHDIFRVYDMELADPWVAFYGEPEPVKEMKKPEIKKDRPKEPEKSVTDRVITQSKNETEDDIPGQAKIDDYPEFQPETQTKKKEEPHSEEAHPEEIEEQPEEIEESQDIKSEIIEADIVEEVQPESNNGQLLYAKDNLEIDFYENGELSIIIKNNKDHNIKKIKAINADTGNIWEVEIE